MINLKINGLNVSVEDGTTLLEASKFLGFPIPKIEASSNHQVVSVIFYSIFLVYLVTKYPPTSS